MHLLRFAGKRPKIPTGLQGKEVMDRYGDSVARKSE